MKQFKDFRLSNKEKKVWQLHKALYGLKQASLSWWQSITKLISVLEFKWYKSNANIYIYYFIDKETRELIIAIVYVDDICFMGSKDFSIKVKNSRLYLFLFLFLYFLFYFLILNLKLEVSMISYMTVTNCHMIIHRRISKVSKQWYYITYLLYINLMDNICSLK